MPKRPYRYAEEPAAVPPPLKRAPRTDLKAHVQELDARAFEAIEAVAAKLLDFLGQSTSLDEIRFLLTKVHMLLAMKGTHRSIRRLVAQDAKSLDLAVDAFPLTRVQLERCFLALLIEDNPERWSKRYHKNAWKAFAEKYFRDQSALSHLEPYREYFGPNGPGIAMLRTFAREMYVWEDELQTLRAQIHGEEMDPRWERRYIADMPTPAKACRMLGDPARRALGELLYPYYDNLSHFTHGGMVGVMQAALLRREVGQPAVEVDREKFLYSNIIETTLPASYVSQLLAATLFGLNFQDDSELRKQLIHAWTPYHSDGSPLGVAVWDSWAAEALGVKPRGPSQSATK